MKRSPLVLVVALGVVAACARDRPEVSDAAARALQPMIAAVRTAAEAGQPQAARATLAELRAQVQALRDRDDITEQGAARVLAAADGVAEHLALIATTTTQPPPPPSRKEDAKHDEDQADRKEEEHKESEHKEEKGD